MQLEELDIAVENESAAIEFAVKRKLLPGKKTLCPACNIGNVGWYKKSNDGLKVPFSLRCSRRRCRKKWSVTKNTWFFGSHLTLRQNFMLIYFWIRGDSIGEASENLRLSKTTVMDYYQFCREVCFVIVSNRTKPVGGPDHVVVISEFQVDRVFPAQVKRVCFLEGYDKTTEECFLIELHEPDEDTVVQLIKKFVRAGSSVITDAWESFNRLNSEHFQNSFSDHPIKFFESLNPDRETNQKRCMFRKTSRFVETESLEIKSQDLLLFQYLYFHPIEYMSPGEKFDRFLEDIALVYPGPFKQPLTAVIY